MTPEQIELARHALGLKDGHKQSYRNYFVAGQDHPDFPNWQAMAKAGEAFHHGPNPIFGGDYCFVLTRDGAKAALRPGERLDTEDFPMDRTS